MPPRFIVVSREDREAAQAASLLVLLKRQAVYYRFGKKPINTHIDLKLGTVEITINNVNARHLIFSLKDAKVVKDCVAKVVKSPVKFTDLHIKSNTITLHLSF